MDWWEYLIIVAVVLFLLIFNISTFNQLVSARNKVKEAFSSIDVHLKLRFDLIPNLVNVVQGYVKHEAEIMQKAAEVRARAAAAKNEEQKVLAANEAGHVISQLFATSEDNPNLKSDKLFRRLQREMIDIEDKISAARRFYNSEINKYNNLVMRFPTNITAYVFGFKKKKNFEIDPIERQNVEVDKQ